MRKEHDVDEIENQMDHPDNFPLWCVALIASALCCMVLVAGICILDFYVLPMCKIIFGG